MPDKFWNRYRNSIDMEVVEARFIASQNHEDHSDNIAKIKIWFLVGRGYYLFLTANDPVTSESP